MMRVRMTMIIVIMIMAVRMTMTVAMIGTTLRLERCYFMLYTHSK